MPIGMHGASFLNGRLIKSREFSQRAQSNKEHKGEIRDLCPLSYRKTSRIALEQKPPLPSSS